MKCPLIFISSFENINIKNLKKLIFINLFDLKNDLEKKTKIGEPILIY
jgi:hypothetical protein